MNKLKVCLAATSGGHLDEILQLNEFYEQYDHFFVTNSSSFAEALSKNKKVYFVKGFVMTSVIKDLLIFPPILNGFKSIKILIKEKPDLIITTGSGTAFPICFLSKLFGKKMLLIESIARVNQYSLSGKVLNKISDLTLVQWEQMQKVYKKSIYGGNIFDIRRVKKSIDENYIFLTVGTQKESFDRLLKEVDVLINNKTIKKKVIAQTGNSDYIPNNYRFFNFVEQKKIHSLIRNSSFVICQGGAGSIFDSLKMNKTVIAVPRLTKFREESAQDDHQLQLVNELENKGLILAVYNIKDLGKIIKEVDKFRPEFPKNKPEINKILNKFVEDNFKKQTISIR